MTDYSPLSAYKLQLSAMFTNILGSKTDEANMKGVIWVPGCAVYHLFLKPTGWYSQSRNGKLNMAAPRGL